MDVIHTAHWGSCVSSFINWLAVAASSSAVCPDANSANESKLAACTKRMANENILKSR